MTIYCEESPDPASNILHVVGRTFSLPHTYFYRHYSGQMWTPWEPITVEIEGDHVVAVVWRERLHLFWVTFLERSRRNDTTRINNKMQLQDFGAESISTVTPTKEVDIQLNWSEYFQGKWISRQSNGFENQITVSVENDFNSRNVFVFVSKLRDGSLLVNLDYPINKAFRVQSKNAPPKEAKSSADPPDQPYLILTRDQPTRYTGNEALDVAFIKQLIIKDDNTSKASSSLPVEENILKAESPFSIVLHPRPFRMMGNMQNLESEGGELRRYVDPFIFQDDRYSFLVEPRLIETTITEWEEWVIPALGTKMKRDLDDTIIEELTVKPNVPIVKLPKEFSSDEVALFKT